MTPDLHSALESATYYRSQHHAGIIPDYEEVLSEGYAKFLKPGDTVIDIGVNHGDHYTQFLSLTGPKGRVIGFEPVPDFIASVRELCGPDVDIRQKAVSDKPGRAEFLFMTRAHGESGFKERASPGDRGATPIEVEISTLDLELADLDRIDYIKIDTEGHEISILKGGMAVIARRRPIISVEYGVPTYSLYGHEARSMWDQAEAMDYRISDLFGNVVQDLEEWIAVCDTSYWDYFLVPSERAAGWRDEINAES